MKRVLILILALTLICSTFAFFGCKKKDAQTDKADSGQQNAADATTQQNIPTSQSGTQTKGIELTGEETLVYSGYINTYSCGEWEYSYRTDDNIAINNYTGTQRNITVPSKIRGHDVVAITRFESSSVEILHLPDTIISIGSSSFRRNKTLKELYCGNSLKSIYADAFAGCTTLEKIVLPSSLETLETSAFYGCGLKRLTVPCSLKTCGAYVFENIQSLTSVIFEEGTTVIYDIFHECPNIEYLVIPASVETIYNSPFYCNTSNPSRLTGIRFLGNAPEILGTDAEPFGPANPNITIYYPANATGWDTTPLGELYTLTPYQPE